MVEGGRFEIYCAFTRTGGSNPPLSAPFDSIQTRFCCGEVTEWLKVHDWNSCVGQLTGGSNPPLSATFRSIAAGEGRGPATVSREPRQAGNGATVASDTGRRSPRLSPQRWIVLVNHTALMCSLVASLLTGGCGARRVPASARLLPSCPDGAAWVEERTESGCQRRDGTWHGLWVRSSPTGQRAEDAMYVDGVRSGPAHSFDETGALVASGLYQAGLRNGPWSWWWPDGSPQTVGAYVAGIETGTWTTWWPNGNKQSEGPMVEGGRHGAWRQWHLRGQLAAEGVYEHGERVGDWSFLDPQGESLTEAAFDARYAID